MVGFCSEKGATMDSITAQLSIRDSLRDNLTDPYTLFSQSVDARDGSMWIFADEPHAGAKYPKVEVLKATGGINSVIGMGSPYTDVEHNYYNVFFYVKNGTTIVVDGTTYKNSQVVDYYQGLIKSTIKNQFSSLTSAGGIKDVISLTTSEIDYDSDTQLYYGYITFRVRHFNVNC